MSKSDHAGGAYGPSTLASRPVAFRYQSHGGTWHLTTDEKYAQSQALNNEYQGLYGRDGRGEPAPESAPAVLGCGCVFCDLNLELHEDEAHGFHHISPKGEVATCTRQSAPDAMRGETLLSYAALFEKQRRDERTGNLDPPSAINLAAAAALRFQAAALSQAPVPAGENAREECAKIVEAMITQIPWSEKPHTRAALRIAANAVRRGRHLTNAEKIENLAKGFDDEGDHDMARKIRAKARPPTFPDKDE